MKFNFLKSRIVLIIIIAVIFGLGAGIVGELLARVYIFEDIFNLPLYGEINLTDGGRGNANLIIRDAKKVVVQQDEKIGETINNIKNNSVGIFKKKALDEGNFLYYINDELAQGIVLTSDGWIISDLNTLQLNENNLDNFFVATRDGKIYQIDQILNDKYSPYSFIHIEDVRDLPVVQFASESEMSEGLLAIVFDWDQNNLLATISGKENKRVLSSDILNDEYFLSADVSGYEASPVYGLSGNLLGFVNESSRLYPIYNIEKVIDSVLSGNDIKRIKVGLNYTNLNDYVTTSPDDLKGVKIVKNSSNLSIENNSPADLVGLKEGDLIVSIDNIELNSSNQFNKIIQKYKKGDTINISFSRGEKVGTASLALNEY